MGRKEKEIVGRKGKEKEEKFAMKEKERRC